jgi:uncharacterized protein YceK
MIMKIRIMTIPFCIALFLTSGCGGTLYTRGKANGYVFGKPVYAAVAEDYDVTVNGVEFLGGFFHYNMIKPFSFPLDFVLDTLFLPFDLIAWGFGYDKNEIERRKNAALAK